MKQSRYSWLSGGYMVVMYFQWGKTWKFDFLNHIWPWRSRSIAPKTIRILTKVFCTSGPNLVILAWMDGELWCGQAQNGVNLDFQVKFDLEGQGRSVHNRDLNQGLLHLCSKFGDPSLNGSRVIARTSKWLTHTQTDAHTQTQATTIPEGQNWPLVKMIMNCLEWSETCQNAMKNMSGETCHRYVTGEFPYLVHQSKCICIMTHPQHHALDYPVSRILPKVSSGVSD